MADLEKVAEMNWFSRVVQLIQLKKKEKDFQTNKKEIDIKKLKEQLKNSKDLDKYIDKKVNSANISQDCICLDVREIEECIMFPFPFRSFHLPRIKDVDPELFTVFSVYLEMEVVILDELRNRLNKQGFKESSHPAIASIEYVIDPHTKENLGLVIREIYYSYYKFEIYEQTELRSGFKIPLELVEK